MRIHLPYTKEQLTIIIDNMDGDVDAVASFLGLSRSRTINIMVRCGRKDLLS